MVRAYLLAATLIIAYCASTSVLLAQTLTPWQIQSPLPASNVIRKASFANERVGWAVGRDTAIIKTTDGGISWQVQRQSVLPRNRFAVREFFDVRAINEQIVWAMANAGTILTRDGGTTWALVGEGGTALFALDERRAWIVSDDLSNGIVRRTRDGGTTWQTSMVQGIRLRDVFFLDSLNGWVAGNDGIASTSDGGATWMTILMPNATTLGGSTRFNGIWLITPNIGFAVAEDSTLIRTLNGGRIWERASVPTRSFDDIEAIRMISARTGYALVEGNILLASTDSGRTWLQRSIIPASTIITDIQFTSEQVGYAFGGIFFNIEESSVWKTLDGGSTWTQLRGTKNMPLYGLARRTNSTLTAVGNTTILQTQNSGRLWGTQLPLPGNADNFAKLYRSVTFLNPNTGYIVGEVGRILKTTNGGETWTQPMERRGSSDWYDCAFANENIGWVVGSFSSRNLKEPVIAQTTNGGMSWTVQTMPSSAIQDTLFSVDAVNENIVFAVGNQGAIYATQNGGATWTRQTSPTRSNLYGVFFLNERQGWAVGGTSESAVILATNDGGTTWRRQLAPADGALRSVFFVDAQLGYAVGVGGIMLVTRNGGTTWEGQESRTSSTLNDVVFDNAVRGWAVGDDGVIVATNNGGFTPQASVSSSLLEFGEVAVGGNAQRTLTISGEYLLEPLTITAPSGFLVELGTLRGQSITLQPNALASTQATIGVRFVPTRDALISGTLTIQSAFISSTVTMRGVGVQRPVLEISPEQTRLTFAATRVGTQTHATISLTNIGVTSGTLSLRIIPTDTTQRPIFSGLPQTLLPITLQPRASETLNLVFTPRTFGTAQAVLEARINSATFDTTYRVTLSGLGQQASVQATPGTLSFGTVSLTQSTLATIGFTNVGNLPASLRRVIIEPNDQFRLASPFAASDLAPQDILTLAVRFTPTSLGFARANLLLISDTDTIRAIVSGTGVPLLDAPTLVSPYNGRINTPSGTMFAWRPSATALQYDVEIARDSTFTTVDISQSALRSLSYTPTTDLRNSTRYFWRVRARNNAASSDWSSIFSFITIRANPLLRASQELIQPSGIVGQTQRGFFAVRSSVSDSIIQADFRFLNDDNSYSLRQDQFPMFLRANVTENLTFDFSPRQISANIRGILRIIAKRDTLLVPFIGEGVARDSTMIFTRVAVQTDRQSASAGDTVMIRLMLLESQNLDAGRNRGKAQSFNAVLKIRNESVLAPKGTLSFPAGLSENILLGNGGKTIELKNIPRTRDMKTGVLAEIPASVLLGNATSTAIEFLSFEWSDTQEQRSIQTVVDSSLATVVCTAGGRPRLIQRRTIASLQAIAPNPVSNGKATAEFSLLETGNTALFLVDVLGRKVRTYFDKAMDWGRYAETLDVSGLPDGTYMLVLQTPSEILRQRIQIIR
ncbi:MAG: YCF48-related protein [Candidatus Kapabacteria bacterium]|jgi:photosystem II stability/assembly factor-like uncharacterized protein|nr:YCF48-related protein [Candidatus Kapabacteria bacterium]